MIKLMINMAKTVIHCFQVIENLTFIIMKYKLKKKLLIARTNRQKRIKFYIIQVSSNSNLFFTTNKRLDNIFNGGKSREIRE